jgi:hypothetical protein
MSGVVDVGDAIELTFTTATGADVLVSWLDPDSTAVVDQVEVTEDPAGSGKFPYTFLASRAGMWTAQFTASGAATAVERYWVRATDFTGPPPLAAIGDVAGQYGTLTATQEGLTGWLLRAASKMVRAAFPNIDDQLTAGTLDRDVVALAVANMVLRVLRNPGGLRSETVGPFSRSWHTTIAAGLLVITDAEAAMFTPLPPLLPATVSPVGTIKLKPGLAPNPDGVTSYGWCW